MVLHATRSQSRARLGGPSMLAVLLLTWVCSWSLAVPVVHADTNVTGQVSAIIARVPNSLGGGRNLAVIKDGDKPPVGTSQSSRQYDSWDGANGASEDWVGYTFSSARTFSRVVFQEGMHFWDGGWFQSLTVQVRQNGTWVSVQGLGISPAYAGNGGGSFQTYTLTFTQSWGDGIRIFGAPGGSAAFISVGELEVYEADGAAGSGGTGSAGTLTGASVTSQSSATIARVPNPLGGGASLAVIKDGIKAPAGSTDSGRQYDSWDGANFASEDWVGYTFSGSREFTGVVFQEGKHFWDGGWFLSLTVQVRQNGSWVGVQGLGISPAYAGNGGGTYQTYTMTFSPISGDGIRIFGEPGGSAAFISVGELDVYASGSSSGSTTSGSSSPPPPSSGPVFYTATDGNDANSGSETAPFRTVSKGVSKLTPGATLYVKAGTYAEALIHNIPRGNSWSQPVTVAAYPGHSVTLQPPSGKAAVLRFVGPQSYIVVRGFILDAVNTQYDGVKVTSISNAGAAHHIRIQDCELKNAPQNGILTTLGAHSNEFVGVSVHDNGQTDFHHGVYLATDSNLVADSDVYRNAGWGVHVYASSGLTTNFNVIRNNRLFDNARVGARGDGIILSSGQGHQAYNNLVWGNKRGIVTSAGARGSLVANNVVYGNKGTGVFLESSSSDTQFRNNIMWQNAGGNYNNSGAATAQSNNLVGVDPRFVNAGARDFRLQAGSPAIDTGTPVSAVTVDFDGVPRPQHGGYDIGAFEWQ